jgi:hypothetical protein
MGLLLLVERAEQVAAYTEAQPGRIFWQPSTTDSPEENRRDNRIYTAYNAYYTCLSDAGQPVDRRNFDAVRFPAYDWPSSTR